MESNFSWNDQVGLVAIEGVAAIAVYTNDSAQIVIRQEGPSDGVDARIFLPAAYLPRLIEALQQELDEFNDIAEEETRVRSRSTICSS